MPTHERLTHWFEGMGIGWLVGLPWVWATAPQALPAYGFLLVVGPVGGLALIGAVGWVVTQVRARRAGALEEE